MGTNYFLKTKGEPNVHIGKSSAGWTFALHVYPENPDLPQSFEDWTCKLKNKEYTIENEYGDTISPRQMIDIITNRSGRGICGRQTPHGYSSWQEFLERNKAIPGPNGLFRSKIMPNHCIGHGDGTYDLHVGYFS